MEVDLQTSSSLRYCWTFRNAEYCSGLRIPSLLVSTRLNTSAMQDSRKGVGFPETCNACHCAGTAAPTFTLCCELYCAGGGGGPGAVACCALYCVIIGGPVTACCGVNCAGIGCGAGMGTGAYVFRGKHVVGTGCAEALMFEFGIGYVEGYVVGYAAG